LAEKWLALFVDRNEIIYHYFLELTIDAH